MDVNPIQRITINIHFASSLNLLHLAAPIEFNAACMTATFSTAFITTMDFSEFTTELIFIRRSQVQERVVGRDKDVADKHSEDDKKDEALHFL